MEKQNTQESRSGLEESAVQQDIHSIHTEQTVSDRQQKDQSEMMYVKLVGLPKADVNQISVTPGKRVQPVYKTPEQFKAFLRELIDKPTTSSQPSEHPRPAPRHSKVQQIVVENSADRLLGVNENTGLGTFLGTKIPQNKKPIPLPRTIKNAQSKQGVPASLHQDMKPAPTLPPRAFEQIKDSAMGVPKPPVPSPRSTPNMDRPPKIER